MKQTISAGNNRFSGIKLSFPIFTKSVWAADKINIVPT